MKLRSVGIVAAVALPALLVVSSVRAYLALASMREVFLRHHAAMLSYQLELSGGGAEDIVELRAHEPDLLGVEIFTGPVSSGADAREVNALFRGETLYFTSETALSGRPVYRVYLPIHYRQSPNAEPKLGVARMDLAAASANFLVRDGQTNLLVASFAAAASLLVLGAYMFAARRRAERERMAELGEMSAVMAHEIRNPLGTIKGYVQLAREKSPAGIGPLLDPAIQEAERLEKLVRDLLLFARPQRLAPAKLHWAEVAARLSPVAEDAAGERPVRVQMDAPPELEIRADPDALFQILSNLVRNAAEALVEGGDIRISAQRDGREVAIAVEDNGPGPDRVTREKAFQPFFTTKPFGTGLGLPISRRLAGQMEGRLSLERVEPHGARAVLTLPAGST